MVRRLWVVLAAASAVLGAGPATMGAAEAKSPPRLDLRASPRMGFPPADVLVVAELKGGTVSEDYYCPALEWDWGDGSRSVEESDCPPFESGMELDRFFSARHKFRSAGNYAVRVTLRRADRTLAVASVAVVLYGHSTTQGN